MRNRTAVPLLFAITAIALFVAGGILLRTGNGAGSAFVVLGGTAVVLGATLNKRLKTNPCS